MQRPFLNHKSDVAIIGGGPAGSAAAITLARAGRSVLLIEKNGRETFKVGESLPPSVLPLLTELGVMQRFVGDGHLISYGNRSAWGAEELQSTDFIRDPNGCGWHVDRPRFDAMLRAAARDAGARVLEETLVTGGERAAAGSWRIKLNEANRLSEVRAQWLIDCSGRRSWLAKREGARRTAYDDLLAFVALFVRDDDARPVDRDSSTLIESVKDGWWYTSLLPARRRVVVYFTDAHTGAAKSARRLEGYLALLEQTIHINELLGAHRYNLKGVPMVTFSGSARLDRVIGDGWMAAGDASASFDPLSSQGILTALYSGLKAGRSLDAHLTGDPDSLDCYAQNIDAVFDAYLRNHTLFYGYERRWAGSPFWKARA